MKIFSPFLPLAWQKFKKSWIILHLEWNRQTAILCTCITAQREAAWQSKQSCASLKILESFKEIFLPSMFYPRYFSQQKESLCEPFLGNWLSIIKPVLRNLLTFSLGVFFFWGGRLLLLVWVFFSPFPFTFPPMHHMIYWQSYRAKLSLESYFLVVKCVNTQLSKENTSPLSFISDSPA